jgi:hypothetical protein
LRPKAITGKWNGPGKATSQGTKSAISKAFGATNMRERQFPRIVPTRIPLRRLSARTILGDAVNDELVSQEL